MVDTPYAKNENGLIGILRILRKRKWLIILGTLAATVLAVVIVLLVPKLYKSKAVISLSGIKKSDQDELAKGMDIPIFRRYADTFQNRALFIRFSKMKGYTGDWDFENWDSEEGFFEEHFKPIYAFDTERPGIKLADNSIIGIKIEGLDYSPPKAQAQTEILGNYLLTTILNLQIGQFIESTAIQSQAALVQAEKSIIILDRETGYLIEKESLLENRLLKLPGFSLKTNRELVTANESTEKYLSPQQQLVSVKMSIKENQIQIDRNLKNAKVDRLILDFIDKIKPLVGKESEYLVNEGLLEALLTEKDKFFSEKTDNESKLASHTLSGQFFYFQKLRDVVYKFISGPTLPQAHFKPKRKRIVIGAFFLAFFALVFLALALENRDRYKKKAPTPEPPTNQNLLPGN